MDWSSVYSARALTIPDYLQGRALFAGDAAHLLPIFGVRGANTAFQDAQSLAWRLAFIVPYWQPVVDLHRRASRDASPTRTFDLKLSNSILPIGFAMGPFVAQPRSC